MSRFIIRTALAVAVVALLASACGSGDEADASTAESGVATLADVEADDPGDEAEPVDAELAADEAALEFSACMRDEGLDFPDIGVDAEGNLSLREAFVDAGISPQDDGFRTAMDACSDLLADAGFGGGGGRAALADNPEVQDALVEFSECIRDEGYDVGDLTLGGPGDGQAGAGQNAPADGEAPEGDGQRGQGQAGFGGRDERLADQLGLDLDNPDEAAAIDTCLPILDTALADAGVAQPGGQP